MTTEREARALSGWVMAPVTFALYAAPAALIIARVTAGWDALLIGALFALAALSTLGYFTLQPNEARVLILFGNYRGTTRQVGLFWANPFYANGPAGRRKSRPRVEAHVRSAALQALPAGAHPQRREAQGQRPAPATRWRSRQSSCGMCSDTARAVFDVEDFEGYVSMQSETALRHLATAYAYDHGEGEETTITLRGNVDEVSQALKEELQERLAKAGVEVDESRLTHLAYAPEIAQAMLRRQQAEAIIAARSKIVEGAVGMVDRALYLLSEKNLVRASTRSARRPW